MSKYNLTDIFEQYQMGSGWTNDFDYEGMLNAGLKIETDTPIEVMKKISDDFEDVNYHRENNYLQGAIDALESGDVFEANGKLNDFRHEIKKTMATFDMDMSDDLGAYMASKMDLDEGDAVDLAIEASQEKAGIKENKDKMNEVRIDREVAGRIEGLLNIPMKAKFLNAFEDLLYDLLDDEPFYVDDVIAHLSNEMHKRVNGNQMAGDRLAGIGESSDEYVDEIGEGAMQKGEADLEAGVKGNMDAFNEADEALSMTASPETLRKMIFQLLDDGHIQPETADDILNAISNSPSNNIYEDNCEKHDYKQIDPDGTAECTNCGLRNSDPSKTGEKVRSEGKGVDFIRALKVDANGTSIEIKSYLESLKRSGDKFDSVDDYVEDFKNYVADKSLQEHFGRFLKDYQ